MHDRLKSLYILDGYFWIFRALYAPMGLEMRSPSGEPTSATYMFVVSLLKLIREQQPDAVVVAMEGKSKTFRQELYEDYKCDRKQPPEEFVVQRDRIEQILGAMHIPVLRAKGFEADDIIGTLTKRAYYTEYEAIICSNDKDMKQLLNECTCMFNVSTCKYLYADMLKEKIGVCPYEFIDYLALQGDAGDNVPGLPNVGPKTAAKWIQKYGSIENLLENVDEIKGRHHNTLIEFKDRLLLGRKLITINCDVPVCTNFSSFDLREFDRDKLQEIFIELGFNQLLVQMELD